MLAAVPLLAIGFCAPAEPPLIDQVRQRRTIRQAGLAIGGTFLTAAATAGVVGGLIEPAPVLTVAVGGAGVAALAVGGTATCLYFENYLLLGIFWIVGFAAAAKVALDVTGVDISELTKGD